MTNNLISLGCIAVIILAGNMAIQYHEFVFGISGSMVLTKTRRVTTLCYRFISAALFRDLWIFDE